jgi:prevent-host-death family protein
VIFSFGFSFGFYFLIIYNCLTKWSYYATIIAPHFNKKGAVIMQIALSELKINVGKYVDIAQKEDIFITRNGKRVAKIIGTNRDNVAEMKSLFGIAKLPAEYDDPNFDPNYKKFRDERMEENRT